MKPKPVRICPIEALPLPTGAHGNKKYHPESEEEAKHINNEKAYSRVCALINLAKRLDDILTKPFPPSNGIEAISKDIHDREGFAWDCNSAIKLTADNVPVFWILNYGYSFADRKGETIIIYY